MVTLDTPHRYLQPTPQNRSTGLIVVLGFHALIVFFLVTGLARSGIKLIEKPMDVAIISQVTQPPPPPPTIVKPALNTPQLNQIPPLVFPVLVQPAVTRAQEPTPEVSVSAPTPVTITAEPVRQPIVDRNATASLEDEYASKVRAMLNSTKRYPTGRAASQQRPQGKVKVWFTLTRAGLLVETGVLESSNSNLLDDAAIGTVRRGTFPSFPPNTWTNEEQHRFVAEIEFNPPS